ERRLLRRCLRRRCRQLAGRRQAGMQDLLACLRPSRRRRRLASAARHVLCRLAGPLELPTMRRAQTGFFGVGRL
ncbi:Rubredoxin HupI, partial [Methylomonas fluvii]